METHRKFVYAGFAILLGFLLLEGVSRFFLWRKDHSLFVRQVYDSFEYADGMRYKNVPNIDLYYSRGDGNKGLYTDDKGFIITGSDLSRRIDPQAYPDERIILLGGSTLAGYGSSGNAATIASRLEQRLRSHFTGRNIEVINAGVGGYFAEQELVYYLLYLSPYKPTIVVTIDGANNEYRTAFPGDPRGPRSDWHDWLNQWQASLNAPLIHYLFARRRDTLQLLIDFAVTPNNVWRTPEALSRLINTLVNKGTWEKLHTWAGTSAVPPRHPQGWSHAEYLGKVKAASYWVTLRRFRLLCGSEVVHYLAVLQPNLGYAKPLSDFESHQSPAQLHEVGQWIGALDETAPEMRAKIFGDSHDAKLLNLTRLFQRTAESRYVDTCHYNDAGQREIAEEVYQALISWIR